MGLVDKVLTNRSLFIDLELFYIDFMVLLHINGLPYFLGVLWIACQAVSTLLSLDDSAEILHVLPMENIKDLLL